jgi:hypothetical protein
MEMRKLKELLWLKLECGLAHRQIERALGVSVGAVSKYCALAARAQLSWAAIACLSDEEIEARLQAHESSAPTAGRVEPDCAHIHRELKRKGV